MVKRLLSVKPSWPAVRTQLILILVVAGLIVGLESRLSAAASWYNVTVRIVGVYSNAGIRVHAGGRYMGTVYGEGTISFNTTYGPVISVSGHTPDGYPYYGYPGYMYPGPSWGPYGYNGVAFICRINSQTAPANTPTPALLTFMYEPVFFLYVRSERGTPEGTGWYPAGTAARVAVNAVVDETGNTRYRFDKWVGGTMQDSTSNPGLVYMDSPKIIEAAWIAQYKLTVNSAYGQVSGGGWYDRDQAASFSVTSPVDGGEGTRYIFSSWSGDYGGSSLTGAVSMNGPKMVTAIWKTQYLLTVDPKGGQVDKTTQWADSGTSVSVVASSPCNVVEKNRRLVFTGWQGALTHASNTVTIVMDSPKSLIATWKTQYYLIVETKRGTATGEGWYDADSVAEFSVPSTVPMEEPFGTLGGKYVFSAWTGDSAATTAKSTITMERAHIVTALWDSDYTSIMIFFTVVAAAVAALLVFGAKRGTFKELKLPTRKAKAESSPETMPSN